MTRTTAFVLIILGSLATASAQDPFRVLVERVPRSANAVVLLNLDKAKASPLGVREGWKDKLENAFQSGVTRVPPEAARFVLATQIDFEAKQPLWEVAMLDLDQPVSIATIAQKRKREAETLDKLPALSLATNAYLIQFGPTTLGAMAPANRQAVLRWVREVQSPTRVPLSAYLEQAARYSDEAGTEIIMAIDLDGVFSLERTVHYLKGKPEQLQLWKADLRHLTKLISDVQGLRLGVRIGDKPYGKVTVDFRDDVTEIAAFAKPLLLEILDDAGAAIDDLKWWNVAVKGTTISLEGTLSPSGLHRLLSLVDSPAPSASLTKDPPLPPAPAASASDVKETMATASLQHFHSVTKILDDLKSGLKDAKTLSSMTLWFDQYAKKIERMPILNVDPDLLNYSAYVARQVRNASLAVRGMGIQTAVRQQEIVSAPIAPTVVAAGGFGSYGPYGGYGRAGVVAAYDPYAEARAVGEQRLIVKSEEKATMATTVQTIRDQVIQATADIRRAMTQKYQVEF